MTRDENYSMYERRIAEEEDNIKHALRLQELVKERKEYLEKYGQNIYNKQTGSITLNDIIKELQSLVKESEK